MIRTVTSSDFALPFVKNMLVSKRIRLKYDLILYVLDDHCIHTFRCNNVMCLSDSNMYLKGLFLSKISNNGNAQTGNLHPYDRHIPEH